MLQKLCCSVVILYGNSTFVLQQVLNLYCAVFDVVAHVRNLVGSWIYNAKRAWSPLSE